MKKRYFMGIDVAKATLDFCLLSKNATLLWRGQLQNEAQAIGQFLAQLQARGYKLAQIHFCCEATGVYGQRLVEVLDQSALALSLLNPAQVKFFAISVLRRTKNDKVDAEIIARFCRERTPLATPLTVKPCSAKSVMPSYVKPFIFRPPLLGAGANPCGLGSLCSKAVNSMILPSAAPLCATSFTSPSAFLLINNPLTPRLSSFR